MLIERMRKRLATDRASFIEFRTGVFVGFLPISIFRTGVFVGFLPISIRRKLLH